MPALSLSLAVGSARADHPTVGLGVEVAGPITTLAATPLTKGLVSIGLRTELINFAAFTDQQLEEFASGGDVGVHSIDYLSSTALGGGYGITDNFTLSAQIPYVVRKNIRESELEGTVPEAHPHGDAKGLGDILLLGQYRVLHKQERGYDGSVILGVKTASGKTDVDYRALAGVALGF